MVASSSTDGDRVAPFEGVLGQVFRLLPGVVLTALIAWAGLWSSEWVGKTLLGFEKSPVSGIMMAILVGLLIRNTVQLPAIVKPGVRFSVKKILRLGIILLGIRLGLGDVLRLGALGVPLIVACVVGAVLFTRWLGARLDLPERMNILIAVGTSICGATAIVATGPAIDAKEEEITYAVANITVFGILAMFLYPYLANALFASSVTHAGLFLGTAIHETAQVAGGGMIYAELFDAPAALDTATVTKLVRNVFMAAVIPLAVYFNNRRRAAQAAGKERISFARLFPVFILGFLGMAIVRTAGDATLDVGGAAYGVWNAGAWGALVDDIKSFAEVFLAMAMAGVGLDTSFWQLRQLGLRPFYVGFGASVVVGALSLAGIVIIGMLELG
jgi:uncharacterized integral membrane protein (TIGR00698 family)